MYYVVVPCFYSCTFLNSQTYTLNTHTHTHSHTHTHTLNTYIHTYTIKNPIHTHTHIHTHYTHTHTRASRSVFSHSPADNDDTQALLVRAVAYFWSVHVKYAKLYPGVIEMLKNLQKQVYTHTHTHTHTHAHTHIHARTHAHTKDTRIYTYTTHIHAVGPHDIIAASFCKFLAYVSQYSLI